MSFIRVLKDRPLHIFLFPLLFVVNHFFTITTPAAGNRENALLWVLNFLGGVITCALPPVVLFFLFRRRFGAIRTGILISLGFALIFFLQDFFVLLDILAEGVVRVRWFFPLILLAVLGLCYVIFKTARRLQIANEFLNILALALMGYGVVTVATTFSDRLIRPRTFELPVVDAPCRDCPDIYFFLLDSYTSNKSLRDFFGFDNSAFVNELSSLGFSVTDESMSRHTNTVYSLGATLNLDSIRDIELNSEETVRSLIRNSIVVRSLEKKGYAIHNYSPFDVGDKPMYYSISPAFPVTYVNGIIQSSVFNMLFEFYYKLRWYGIHRGILNNINKESLERNQSPDFFYGHLLAPHPPFVIDSLGNEIGFFQQPKNKLHNTGYVNQVKGLNTLVLAAVEELVAQSPDAVFIIMGDHGYRHLEGPARVKEGNTVFLAYRGPGRDDVNSLPYSNKVFSIFFNEPLK